VTPVTVTSPSPNPDLLDETLRAVSGLVGEPLEVVGDAFPGSRRTLVVRVRSAGRSLVVKRYLGEDGREADAREADAREAFETGVLARAADVPESRVEVDYPPGQLARAVETTYAATDVPLAPTFTGGTFQ
jgi:hypothetical protein